MGSVASFVGDVVGGAVDVVGDVVEGVGDIGQDIIDVAADTVETVGDTVGDVVQGALDDPIGTAITIGTAVYAPHLLPVVSAGNVIANGGNIEDALISAGAVYAGQTVASTLNSQLGTALDYGTDVGSSQTGMLAAQDAGLFPTNAVVSPVGNVAGVTTTGVLQGQDLEDALERGLISGAGRLVGQEVGMQTGSPTVGNVAGAVAAGTLAGQDPTQILSNSLVNNLIDQGIGTVRDTINSPATDTTNTTAEDTSGFSPEELAAIEAGTQDAENASSSDPAYAELASNTGVASDAYTNTPIVETSVVGQTPNGEYVMSPVVTGGTPSDTSDGINWDDVPNIDISGVGVTPEEQMTPPPETSFLDTIGGILGLGDPDQTADYVSMFGSGATSNAPITLETGLVGTGTVPTPPQITEPTTVDLTPINDRISGVQSGLEQLGQTQQTQYDQLSAANKDLYNQMVAQGASGSEALNTAMANQSQALSDVQSNLTGQIGDVQSNLTGQIGDVQSNLTGQIGGVQSGLEQLGQTQQTQYDQLSAANKDLYNQMVAQGASQSEALNTAMTNQSQALENVRSDLVGEIGNVQSNLTGQIGQLGQQTGQQFANLTASQQAEVQARIAQGQDLQSAINGVQSNLTGQIGGLQSGLSNLGQQVQAGNEATQGALGNLGGQITSGTQATTGAINQLSSDFQTALAANGNNTTAAIQSLADRYGTTSAEMTANLQNSLGSGFLNLGSQIQAGTGATTGAIGQLGSDLTTQNQALQTAIGTGNQGIINAVQSGNQGVIDALGSGNTTLAAAIAAGALATTTGLGQLGSAFSGLSSRLASSNNALAAAPKDLGAGVVTGKQAELGSLNSFKDNQGQQQAAQAASKADDLYFDESDIEYAAEGGQIEHNPQFFSEGGLGSLDNRYVKGEGDGTSDSVPAMLASGEFVIPADVVSGLGNGDNDSGAEVLDKFMKAIRKHKRAADPSQLPEDSKGPLAYLQEAMTKVRT